nr:ATP-dependent acyl-CoA ligase [Actinomadura rugatobispora]
MARPFEDVAGLVDTLAAAEPDRTVLVWAPFDGPSRSWTARALADETRRCAAGLADRGVRAGDRVGIHLGNRPEFVVAWLACARLGAAAVTSNTRLPAHELRYVLADSAPAAVITQPEHAGTVVRAAPRGGVLVTTGGGGPRGAVPFEELLSGPPLPPGEPVDPTTPCGVQYTSGTTSRPKGVVWTHANALWAATSGARVLGLGPDDVQMVYLPLFHTNALALSFLPALAAGATTVLLPRFSASRFWDAAREHGCTTASMTGFALRALAARPDPAGGHRFRLWAAGAGDQPLVAERWGIRLIGWYGSTETVAVCLAGDPDRPGPPGSMGRPVPGYEVAVRRPDGTAAGPGESGRLWVRGARGVTTFLEYLDDPLATAAAFDADGWYDTGDEAAADAAGWFFFRGRAKDMLKVGGENVAAVEIETVVAGVDGVAECAVVAGPDPMLDEVPVAFVVASGRVPDLAGRIRLACDRALADFKRPREIHLVDALPKGTLGKVLKNELRARLRKEPAR